MKKEVLDVAYDLRKPCKDCPFRSDAEFHGGVAKSLPEYFSHMELGTFVHTCHKTDYRADSPEGKKHKGKVQHCGGLLLMMANDVSLIGIHQARALTNGKWKPEKMDKRPKVFGNMFQMARYYYKLLKRRVNGTRNNETAEGKRKDLVHSPKGV